MQAPRSTAPNTKDTRMRLPSSWSARSSLGFKSFERPKPRRPTISGPSGPVKNSRGPDLKRSETLIIVGGIDDCGYGEKDEAGNRSSLRISAGLRMVEEVSMARPTVARSSVMASTTTRVPSKDEPAKLLRKQSLAGSSSVPKFKMSSTATLLPRLHTGSHQDENIPPDLSPNETRLPPLPNSKLPKSRTMNVLHDIKATIARPSLTMRSVNSLTLSTPISTSSTASSTTTTASTSTTSLPTSPSKLRFPRKSLASLTRPRAASPEVDPFRIATAQPSAYWSGRFVALHDRLSTETLIGAECPLPPPKPLGSTPKRRADSPVSTGNKPGLYRPTKLSYSTTSATLTGVTPGKASASFRVTGNPSSKPSKAAGNDPDACSRRVFLHLHALCSTAEARRSLHDFQQAYARRTGKPGLLPQDGCMEERSLMARFFGGRKDDSRRRLSVMRDSVSRGGKRSLGRV